MALEHDVALHMGTSGLRLDVWDSYRVTVSMLKPGQPWSFGLWKSANRRAAWWRLLEEVRFGERVFFSIDGAAQLNGYIETIEHDTDAEEGEFLVISGRDMAGPAVSWHADPTLALKGSTLLDALARLFGPLGIAVRIGAAATTAERMRARRRSSLLSEASATDIAATSLDLTPATADAVGGLRQQSDELRARALRLLSVDRAHPHPGETVWQVADSIARQAGYLLWIAPDPEFGLSVVVDSPAYDSAPVFHFVRRVGDDGRVTRTNVLGGRERTSIETAPSVVTAYCHTQRGDAVSARSAATVENTAIRDPAIAGRWANSSTLFARPMHIEATKANTPAHVQRAAERAIADANARFRTITYRAEGHGQMVDYDLQLFGVNGVARVDDDRFEIEGERWLVLEVTFEQPRGGGRTTNVTIGPPHAIRVIPEEPTP